MGLQFVIGASGSGKSYLVQHSIVQEAALHPDKKYFFLVPDQFTMQTQKDLVLTHTKGIMNIDVLSFGRLSHRLFEENGGDDMPVLDDTGKSLVLRKVAGDCAESLPVIGAHLRKTGYIHEVKSALSEFYQYGIDREKMEEMIHYAADRGALCHKLKDLSSLYQAFQDYINEKYITKEEILDQAARLVSGSKMLQNSVVVLDGFTGFTPVQNRFIRELFGVIDQLIVTVTMDPMLPLDTAYEEQNLFAMSFRMVQSLSKLAEECHFELEQEIRLKDKVWRFDGNESMAFLEKELFRYQNRYYEGEQDAIRIVEASDPREEIHEVCAEVARMVQEEGYAYRDMALITGAQSDYEYFIEEECRRMNIPLYMDHTAKLGSNAAMDYCIAALQVIKSDFAYEDVFHFLRNPFSRMEEEQVDLLENYCIEKGIRGRKRYERMFTAKPGGTKKPEERLEQLNEIREKVIAKFAKLSSKKNTVEGYCRAIYAFMVDSELESQCEEWEQHFTEENDLARAKEYGQVYRSLIALLDQFVNLLGEETVDFSEMLEILKAGIDESKVGTLPQNVDRFVAGDMERTRLTNIKVLFFVGCNDGIIPKKGGKGGIINDIDREFLCDGQFEMAPSPRQKMYIQRFYLYLNMTKPRDRLIMSYSKTNAEGKTLRPSYLVETVRKLFPTLIVTRCTDKDEKEKGLQIRSGNDAVNLLAEEIREYAAGRLADKQDQLFSLYDMCKKNEELEKKVYELTEAAFYRYEAMPLKKEIVRALYSTVLYGSVSRFERFADCSYSYFLQYGLKLSKREGFDFEAQDLGTVYHAVLEGFSNHLAKERLSWLDFSKEKGEELVEKVMDEVAAGYHDTILYSSARKEYLIRKMKRIMKRTVDTLQFQLRQGQFVPSDFELSFDAVNDPNLRMKLSTGDTLRVDGRIDRIDLCEREDQVFVKVIDYKSGKKDLQLAELYYGKQLQLVVYMNAALSEIQNRYPGKEVVPAAMFYYSMQDPFVKRKEDAADEEYILEDIRKELKPKGAVLSNEEVVYALDASGVTKSLVIPVERKKDGSFASGSETYEMEELRDIREFVNHKIKTVGEQIMQGKLALDPCVYQNQSSCEFCSFKGACGFDPKIPGEEVRELSSLSKEEALEKIRLELKENE